MQQRSRSAIIPPSETKVLRHLAKTPWVPASGLAASLLLTLSVAFVPQAAQAQDTPPPAKPTALGITAVRVSPATHPHDVLIPSQAQLEPAETITVTVTEESSMASVPAKPVDFRYNAGILDVTVAWENPNDPAITGWQYRLKTGTGRYSTWINIIPDTTATTASYTVTGLSPTTSYAFQVRALNDSGIGPASDEVVVCRFRYM